MSAANFSTTLVTDKSEQDVFNAIIDARKWWSGYFAEEFTGDTDKLNDEFDFHAGDGAHYSRMKVVEVTPNKKVVWLVTDSELTFVEDKYEWTGTKVIFDISRKDGKTHLVFTHEGLTPQFQCYDSCAPAWTQYLHNKLLPLINTGKAQQ